jgi:hypothetical protein
MEQPSNSNPYLVKVYCKRVHQSYYNNGGMSPQQLCQRDFWNLHVKVHMHLKDIDVQQKYGALLVPRGTVYRVFGIDRNAAACTFGREMDTPKKKQRRRKRAIITLRRRSGKARPVVPVMMKEEQGPEDTWGEQVGDDPLVHYHMSGRHNDYDLAVQEALERHALRMQRKVQGRQMKTQAQRLVEELGGVAWRVNEEQRGQAIGAESSVFSSSNGGCSDRSGYDGSDTRVRSENAMAIEPAQAMHPAIDYMQVEQLAMSRPMQPMAQEPAPQQSRGRTKK